MKHTFDVYYGGRQIATEVPLDQVNDIIRNHISSMLTMPRIDQTEFDLLRAQGRGRRAITIDPAEIIFDAADRLEALGAAEINAVFSVFMNHAARKPDFIVGDKVIYRDELQPVNIGVREVVSNVLEHEGEFFVTITTCDGALLPFVTVNAKLLKRID